MAANSNRKPIPKSVRFEVLKRESFKCHYCGAAAPDVLPQVDHIKPVSKGGTNDLLNLITSCAACNAGKSDKALDDKSALQKSRKQMDELQARREQFEMMMNWQEGLRNLEDETVTRVCEYWHRLAPGYECTADDQAEVAKWIKQFSPEEVCKAMDAAASQYLIHDTDGNTTDTSWDEAFTKIPGICRNKRAGPDVARLYYIRGIVRKRLADRGYYYDHEGCIILLKDALSSGVPLQELEVLAKEARNWSQFRDAVGHAME